MTITPADSPAPDQAPPRISEQGFWWFVRAMLRSGLLVLAALVMVCISGVTLGVGLLAARPVLRSILGDHADLPRLATDLNTWIDSSVPWASPLHVPQAWIDRLPAGPFTALVWIVSGLCLLTVVGSIANFLHAYLSLTVVNRTVTMARRRAFHVILRAPLRTVVASGPTDVISRIVNDSSKVGDGLNVLTSKAILQVFKGIAGLCVALWYDWRVTLVALLVAPVLYHVIRKLGKRIKRYSGAALESQAGLYHAAAESLQGLRVVKVYTTELYEGGRFHRINKKMLRELNRVRTARALASPLTEMLSIFLLCGLVLAAANAIVKQSIDPGDFIMAIGSLAVAGASLKPLTGIVNDIQATMPAADRLRQIMLSPPEPGHGPGLPRLPRHAQSIEFRGVGLTYSGATTPALRSISLRIPHGKRVAFVGPNGCGKTTLLSLVPRLFDPDTGAVLIDGRDLRDVSVRSLRQQVGVVTQDTVLFRATIRANIAYGCGWATQHDIEAAAVAARAHDFIRRLPQGYDTPVAEQGQSLSGGQRQRIAIARAILRNPAILILDEATSMIDSESESQIAEAIAEFSASRTCLVVAHRMATVLGCDSIVVMDAGQIVDQGMHDQLLSRCELYRQLARHQLLPAETT
ncbi:MAG: ABC transporter ATP-binding protein [Phycisphaerales bacterium]